jgi:ATP-dependent DNA helicase DinG
MGAEIFENAMESMGLLPRPQQSKLVDIIRQNNKIGGVKFVQAGTGTGKSFAILTTALEAALDTGEPSIVVCPNNSLIDQYVLKDAPRVAKAAGGKFVYVKGRSRYLCTQARALQENGGEQHARDEYDRLTARGKVEWADHGLDYTYGCPGALDCTPDNAWVMNPSCDVHSGHSRGCTETGKPWECDCKGPKPYCSCKFYCGAFEAKRKAQTADVVITNAHVLVWDYLVQSFTGGQVQLLPTAGALLIDECHEVEAVGRACQSDEIKPGSKVYDLVNGLREWVDNATLAMFNNKQTEGLLGRDDHIISLAREAKAEADELLARAETAGQEPSLAKEYQKEAKVLMRFVDFVSGSEQHISTIELQPTAPYEDPKSHLRRICVDTALLFRDLLTRQPSILVSGTIPASDPRRLGVGDLAKIDNVGHPFDYSKSRLVISNLRGNDRDSTYQRAKQVANAINSTGGGALILFTSWKDLEEVMPLINYELRPEIAAEVYVQSKEDPASLKQDVEEFRANGNAVLAGVRSLFTGLDIPGPALRNVCLWKMPYGVPTLEAKAVERIHGKQTYWDAMLTVLTQGIGRLVRTTEDSGLVFIADSRAKGQRWQANQMTTHLAEFSK